MDTDTIPLAQTSGFETGYELFHLVSRLFGGDGSLRLVGVDIDDTILIIALVPKDPRDQIRWTLHDGTHGALHDAGLCLLGDRKWYGFQLQALALALGF